MRAGRDIHGVRIVVPAAIVVLSIFLLLLLFCRPLFALAPGMATAVEVGCFLGALLPTVALLVLLLLPPPNNFETTYLFVSVC